ncbi:nicotinate phosphoribosyltransferase [Mycoplasmopsis californica HAZ160_1]|uniref:Nicotinate phosphoribosyltransferase n=2 Tax=Mycoplasmopsis californica TaxID=2113 RepID=A0A059XSA2_9BACT|nr:nicotinate phosphoribosyltransferase [Mycoplasmopsis californica]AIA29683.1 nicotinate phosphoribosyltransferase [Mycoplasmopsis californica]BAP00887.1 nicotinate phosphoribosyltransferase [Mycoplasmopsis californica HAZ160_1]BBG42523.1 nicotinate phosphoribosyltransferase [Mycoplasmopsis californica]BBG43097.1 nicotinate phosphoribosyltransferase [Mycoplasmopsis californica]
MSTKYDKYISSYFHRTNEIIEKYKPNNVIKLQFFQRTDNCLLAGMDEVLDLLKNNTDTSKYTIRHLPEGTIVNNLEIVLELEGQYQYFGKYEGMIDGILSRSSNIATNARNCVLAANGKDIIFMGDRADHWMLQEIDGKACRLAGCTLMSTEAQEAPGIKEATFGSVPHCLIQNFDGDVASAMQAYMELFPQDKLISLVDYHNDVIADSLASYKAIGQNLYGVRVDTSKNMKDHMFDNEPDNPEFYGVNVEQIKRLRQALDNAGAKKVKIAVSSGFNAAKIAKFEASNAPVDAYGVGQAIFKPIVSFSADATWLNGHAQAKEGRWYRQNNKLITYKPQND